MSTSLLYHAFGIRGYRYVRTDYLEGEVIFTIEQPRATPSLLRLRLGGVWAQGARRVSSAPCPSAASRRTCSSRCPGSCASTASSPGR